MGKWEDVVGQVEI